jgi:PBP1b-binding outer membrane lipoprotein LpoB
MKKYMALIILTAMILASCTSYVCPTYAHYNPHKKVKVNYK